MYAYLLLSGVCMCVRVKHMFACCFMLKLFYISIRFLPNIPIFRNGLDISLFYSISECSQLQTSNRIGSSVPSTEWLVSTHQLKSESRKTFHLQNLERIRKKYWIRRGITWDLQNFSFEVTLSEYLRIF